MSEMFEIYQGQTGLQNSNYKNDYFDERGLWHEDD